MNAFCLIKTILKRTILSLAFSHCIRRQNSAERDVNWVTEFNYTLNKFKRNGLRTFEKNQLDCVGKKMENKQTNFLPKKVNNE